MELKIAFLAVCLLICGTSTFAQKKKAVEIAPDQVVKNLYAARKSPKTDPFFQNKNRALLDKFFTKELADVIWNDIVSVKPGESGNLDFDPLYNAQDTKITHFVVGKADDTGTVKVTFKNFGKDEVIRFELVKETTASKTWKISTIMYSSSDDLGAILESGNMTDAEREAEEKENKLNGDYMVGPVKCNIATNISGYYARVQCDDQENFQVVDTETLTFGTFDPSEKGRKGHFVRAEDGSIVKFVDASGKELTVTRAK
jgi:hypothetical protein